MSRLVELCFPVRLETFVSGLLPPLVVGLLVLLAGCATAPEPKPMPAGKEVAPPTPVVEVPKPAPPPKPPPPPEPVQPPTPVEEPVVLPDPADEAAAALSLILSGQLGLDDGVVTVVEATESVWPNACLGFPAEGEICADVLTPGFAITLEAEGQRYSYRTDELLERIRLVAAPLPDVGIPLVIWKDTRSSFATATVGTRALAVGLRGGPRLTVPVDSMGREHAIAALVARFAPFQGLTEAGEVDFRGQGTEIAGPLEQRMVAEWVRGYYEAVWIEGNPDAWSPALSWERTGGIAGFCDIVAVTAGGEVLVTDCRGETSSRLASVWLDSRQLAELYGWIDTLESFQSEQTDQASADGLRISIILNAQGWKTATPDDLAAIHRLASDLYLQGYEQSNGSSTEPAE